MSEDLKTIAQRLVAHPRWDSSTRLRWVPQAPCPAKPYWSHQITRYDYPPDLPDLTGWATIGVLLGMLAESESTPQFIRSEMKGRPWVAGGEQMQCGLIHDHPGGAVGLALLEAWGG